MDELKKELFSSEDDVKRDPIKVYLRIRPFSSDEVDANEDQGCIIVKDESVVELSPPVDSFCSKSAKRTHPCHKFTFNRVFDDRTKQKDFFDETMLPFISDILDGQNGIVFTYGITNSGKTFTVNGKLNDGGILPRTFDVIFNSIEEKKYTNANIKPKYCSEVTLLNEQELVEEVGKKNAIMATCKAHNRYSKLMSTALHHENSSSIENHMVDLSSIQHSTNNYTGDFDEEIRLRVSDVTSICIKKQGHDVKFAVWVSFLEIYQELIFDLLDTSIVKGRKRNALKLGDDKNKNPYVKGLNEVLVASADEAYKLMRLGQENQHIASTKLNQASSRSHSIFTIKLLKIVDNCRVARVSRISIVDLAGSERYCKTQAIDSRLKEAGKINTSIMTLGQCISTLRYNQEHPKCMTIIPFRGSKLTRLFQSFFLGKGKASMIVNVSKCASVFDETFKVMEFSAIAKRVQLKSQRATELWKSTVQPLSKPSPVPHNICIVAPAKRTLNDPTAFSYDELVSIVAELRDKIKVERREKSEMETNLRRELVAEMNEIMIEREEFHKKQLEEQRENLEDYMEKRMELLTKLTKNLRDRDRQKMMVSSSDDIQAKELSEKDEEVLMLKHEIEVLRRAGEGGNMRGFKEFAALQADYSEIRETVQLLKRDAERMQQDIQDKDDEIEKLSEIIDEDTVNEQSFQTALESIRTEKEALQGKVEELTTKLTASNENFKIRETNDLVEELKSMLKMVMECVQSHHSESQQTSIDENSNVVGLINNLLEEKKHMFEELQVQFYDSEAKCKELVKNMAALSESHEREKENFKLLNEKSQEELQQMRLHASNSAVEKAAQEEIIQTLAQEVEVLKSTAIQGRPSTGFEHLKQKNKLKEAINELEVKAQKSEVVCTKLKMKISNTEHMLCEEKRMFLEEQAQWKEKVDELKEEHVQWKATVDELKGKLAAANEEIENLKKELSLANDAIHNMESIDCTPAKRDVPLSFIEDSLESGEPASKKKRHPRKAKDKMFKPPQPIEEKTLTKEETQCEENTVIPTRVTRSAKKKALFRFTKRLSEEPSNDVGKTKSKTKKV